MVPALAQAVVVTVLALAAPRGARPPPDPVPADPVELAQAAWSAASPDYRRVRELLEPMATDETLLPTEQRETVLLLLADATILDRTMPMDFRRPRAMEYLTRLLDADDTFQFPVGLYSQELDAVYFDLREQRSAQRAAMCEGELGACMADASELEAEMRALTAKHDDLQLRFDAQEVQVKRVVQRSRALAIFPLGISHFYSGRPGLGAGFLAAEAVFGSAGLALLIVRNTVYGCRRERGFQAGSLNCSERSRNGGNEEATRNAVVVRRRWEEGMAAAFLVTSLADVILAQILFRPYSVVDEAAVPRRDLDTLDDEPRKRQRREWRKKREADPNADVRASLRPTGAVIEGGAGAGLRLRF